MATLKRRIQRVSLSFMGDDWGSCYIDLTAPFWSEMKAMDDTQGMEAVDKNIATLKQAFVGGVGIDEDGKAVDLTAADIDQLDPWVQGQLSLRLVGAPDPNA